MAGRKVPLETDFSAQMMFVLKGTDKKSIELTGFFEPERVEKYAGLYMTEAFQPDNIPVVFVHG